MSRHLTTFALTMAVVLCLSAMTDAIKIDCRRFALHPYCRGISAKRAQLSQEPKENRLPPEADLSIEDFGSRILDDFLGSQPTSLDKRDDSSNKKRNSMNFVDDDDASKNSRRSAPPTPVQHLWPFTDMFYLHPSIGKIVRFELSPRSNRLVTHHQPLEKVKNRKRASEVKSTAAVQDIGLEDVMTDIGRIMHLKNSLK